MLVTDFQIPSITRTKTMHTSDSMNRRTDKLVDLQLAANELELQKELIKVLAIESEKQELIRSTQIEESELLSRLLKAGFCSESLSALELFPIAFVAWASGSVTDRERTVVMGSLVDYGLLINQASSDRFQGWLDTRPDHELLILWKDYTTAKLTPLSSEVRRTIGIRLLKKSTEISMASGGFFGFGTICDAEQVILDEISEAFGLKDCS